MAKKSLAVVAQDIFILTDIQEVDMFIDKVVDAAGNPITDAAGNPVGVENITWTTADSAILSIVNITPDGRQATIRTTGQLTLPGAVAQVAVNADLIVGEGEKLATTIREFQVVTSEAVGFSTGVGTPRQRELTPPV